MRKIILLSFLLLLFTEPLSLAHKGKDSTQKKTVVVYICDSKTAYAYHTSNSCRGLNRCTHAIVKMTETEARSNRRTPCKVCH